jgi:SMODS and SLOG-associating 2TM effector domain 1
MTPEEMILAAEDSLGAERTDDYKIEPTRHAGELAAKAPSLALALRKSELSVVSEEYERLDGQANRHQHTFKDTANRANWAVFLTACFSTLLLVAGPLKSVAGLPLGVVHPILGVCGVISGALGSMWVYRAREGKLLDNWMRARAAAESLRTQYFETITSLQLADSNSPITPALLQFEYFRRYQLDVQVAFYRRRAEDHGRDADRLLVTSAYSVALASISAGLAAVLSGVNPAWISIAALGTAATALASFASTKESVNQSRRNMERYTNTCDALTLLKRKLDAVRTAAAAGEMEPMKQFVKAAHEQIGAEHRQWLAAAKSMQPAIDKLEDTLSKLKSKTKEPKSK